MRRRPEITATNQNRSLKPRFLRRRSTIATLATLTAGSLATFPLAQGPPTLSPNSGPSNPLALPSGPPSLPNYSNTQASSIRPINPPSTTATLTASSQPGSQQNNGFQGNNPVANQASGDQFKQPVYSFRDPRTGVAYDRYLEPESVPAMRWEWQEVTERRWVPQNVTENRQVTQIEYQPLVSYQAQQQIDGRWNPFATPQTSTQFVPMTQYQPVNKVVTQPVTYQKYVEQDVKVRVPKLVQATESRMHYVDRPRSGTAGAAPGNPIAASNYPLSPIYQPANPYPAVQQTPIQYAPGPYAENPYYAPQAVAVAVPSQVFPLSPQIALQQQAVLPSVGSTVLSAPSTAPPPGLASPYVQTPILPANSVAIPSPANYAATPAMVPYNPANSAPVLPPTNTTASKPLFSWPKFLTREGPLFNSSILTENRSVAGVAPVAFQPPYGTGSAFGIGSGNAVAAMPAARQFTPQQSSPAVFPSTSNINLQSSTAPGTVATQRNAQQQGQQATVLR